MTDQVVLNTNIDFKSAGVKLTAGDVLEVVRHHADNSTVVSLPNSNDELLLLPGEYNLASDRALETWFTFKDQSDPSNESTIIMEVRDKNLLCWDRGQVTIEPYSVVDAEKIIAWCQRWIEANNNE